MQDLEKLADDMLAGQMAATRFSDTLKDVSKLRAERKTDTPVRHHCVCGGVCVGLMMYRCEYVYVCMCVCVRRSASLTFAAAGVRRQVPGGGGRAPEAAQRNEGDERQHGAPKGSGSVRCGCAIMCVVGVKYCVGVVWCEWLVLVSGWCVVRCVSVVGVVVCGV